MADGGESMLAQAAKLNRRNLFGAAVGGALLGSAWAVGLRATVTAGDDAHVTIARSPTAYGVLFEHRGHRVMLVDACDGPGANAVTALATGIAGLRIDTVCLTANAAASLPRDYRRRWNVRDIMALPDGRNSGPSSVAGRSLRIGDLAIVADTLPLNAWYAEAPVETDWYIAASLGQARVLVASDGDALTRLPLDPASLVAVICLDTQLALDAAPQGIDALVAPVEAAGDIPEGLRIVTLSPTSSTTLRLRDDRIETP